MNDVTMMERPVTEAAEMTKPPKISASDVQVYYGDNHAIKDVNVEIEDHTVTAFIGPSGCGKSTFLRCINRMNDTIDIARMEGTILIDGHDIYARDVDPVQLRARVGMVFQKPNPFPKSIYDNVAYGPRIHGLAKTKADLDVIVEKSLRRGAIWDEVKDRLHAPGTGLSGGQQQRVAIARALLKDAPILLLDEATSALDAQSEHGVQQALERLMAGRTTLVIAHRLATVLKADRIVVMDQGRIVAEGTHAQLLAEGGLYAELARLQFID